MTGTTKRAVLWLIVLLVFIALLFLASALTEGDKIQGIAPIIITIIGALAVFVVYLFTASNAAWEIGTRQVV